MFEKGIVGRYFDNLKRKGKSALIDKITETAAPILAEIIESPKGKEVGSMLMGAVTGNLIGENGLSLFQGNGPLQETLMSLMSGGSENALRNPLLNLLRDGEKDDGEIFGFLSDPASQKILDSITQMGEGAGAQAMEGLSNTAYREWLNDNPAPPHPSKIGIPETAKIWDESSPEKFECSFCHTITNESICPGCFAPDGLQGFRNAKNPDWTTQERKVDDWLQKSNRQKEELGMDTTGKEPKEIGAALLLALGGAATAGGGLGFTELVKKMTRQPDNEGDNGATAENIVANSLSGISESRHSSAESDDFRLENMTPQEALTQLKEAATKEISLGKYEKHEGSILAEEFEMATKATINGTVVFTEGFWSKGVRGMKIDGDLVIIGELTGFKMPEVTGNIYLVNDKEVNIKGSVQQQNVKVIECTIDKAFQIAQQAGLLT